MGLSVHVGIAILLLLLFIVIIVVVVAVVAIIVVVIIIIIIIMIVIIIIFIIIIIIIIITGCNKSTKQTPSSSGIIILVYDTSCTADITGRVQFWECASYNVMRRVPFHWLDPRLSLLCQVGDDLIRPCKICRGCQIRVPRSIDSFVVCPIQSRLQSV